MLKSQKWDDSGSDNADIKQLGGGAGTAGLWSHFEWQVSRVGSEYCSRRKTGWDLKWALKHGCVCAQSLSSV